MSVEVRDGRIHWVGSESQGEGNRATVRVVDGRARTLIPGLMDCHVHYSSPGGPEWIARFTDPLPEISMRAIELAEASLRSGVTTARDVGAPQGVSIRLARAARAGEIRAPNIRAAGSWIAHRGAYVACAREFAEAGDLAAMVKNKTYLVPTMSVWDAMLYYARAVDWPETRKKRAEDLRKGSRAAVIAAIKAGVRIALGTDSGGGAARHGRIAREAELMVECGMEPQDALIAATSNAAKLIGEDERGTIEEGKIADVVLLDANPLENIGALRMIAAVFQEGRRVA